MNGNKKSLEQLMSSLSSASLDRDTGKPPGVVFGSGVQVLSRTNKCDDGERKARGRDEVRERLTYLFTRLQGRT